MIMDDFSNIDRACQQNISMYIFQFYCFSPSCVIEEGEDTIWSMNFCM